MLENKEQEKIAGIISDFFDGTMSEADIDILAMKIYEKYVAKLEQELAELKEKAIVPKFKIGKEIYFVIDKVEKGKIEKVFITVSKNDDENSIFYSITDIYGYALRLPEEQLFATLKEAEKKLQELRGGECHNN